MLKFLEPDFLGSNPVSTTYSCAISGKLLNYSVPLLGILIVATLQKFCEVQ